jgi:His Kinase A (phospho-acceptor) domain
MTSEQTDSRSKSEREEIGQFLASISHDLKQPLRTICSYSDLLWQRLETSRDNDVNRFLTNVRDAANRMQTLLDDALEFALAEASGRERDWVDMGAVVRFALSNLEAAITQTGAAVTCDRLPPFRATSEPSRGFSKTSSATRSSIAPSKHREFMWAALPAATVGSFRSPTMESGSGPNTSSACSSPLCGCTRNRSTPERDWAWPFAGKSWHRTTAAYGSIPHRARARRSISLFRVRARPEAL